MVTIFLFTKKIKNKKGKKERKMHGLCKPPNSSKKVIRIQGKSLKNRKEKKKVGKILMG